MVQHKAILTIADQQKVVYVVDLSNGAIFNDLERPLNRGFTVMPFFDAKCLRNDTRYRHSFKNTTQQCHFERS